MNLIATQDNLVLKAVFASGITAGGIVMPGVKQFEDGAVVTSVGPNVEDIVIGDVVVRPDPPRFTVVDDETEELYWLVAEADILAKMLPDKEPITNPARLLLEGKDGSRIEGEKSENGIVGGRMKQGVTKHSVGCSLNPEQGGNQHYTEPSRD